MKINNNYISVVALGSFNPAILTPDFLKDKINFKLEKEKYNHLPNIVSNIQSGNYSFLMELNRFQIKESNLQDFKQNKIIDLICEYFKVLEYTPLAKVGLNFNLSFCPEDELKFINKIYKRKSFLDILKVNEVEFELRELLNKNNENKFVEIKIGVPITNISTVNIHIKKEVNYFLINYNYDIRLDKQNIFIIREKFNNIYKQFLKTINYLSGD